MCVCVCVCVCVCIHVRAGDRRKTDKVGHGREGEEDKRGVGLMGAF